MDRKLFEVICKASPEFREMMQLFSFMSEREGKSLKENLELWDSSTLPNIPEGRNQENATND